MFNIFMGAPMSEVKKSKVDQESVEKEAEVKAERNSSSDSSSNSSESDSSSGAEGRCSGSGSGRANWTGAKFAPAGVGCKFADCPTGEIWHGKKLFLSFEDNPCNHPVYHRPDVYFKYYHHHHIHHHHNGDECAATGQDSGSCGDSF